MSNKISKTTSVLVGLTTAIMMSGVLAFMPVNVAHGQTMAELQTQIAALLAQITTLQTQLTSLQGGTPATCGYTFAADLKKDDTGTDVMNLQKVLNSDSATMVASTGVGSAGMETEFFGSLTKAAVIKFQDKYASEVLAPISLTAGTGYVGSMSRAKLNALFGTCGTTPVDPVDPTAPVVPGTGLTISSIAQPTATLAVNGAARVPFTKFSLTAGADGPVIVTGIVVERTGLAHDAVFAGLVLLDGNGTQIGIAKTLNSVHQSTVGETVTIPAGETKTFTVAGNMNSSLTSYAGEVAYLSVVGVNTTAEVSGLLPITGAGHTMNATLSIGSVTTVTGPLDPGAIATKEVGTTGYTFSSIKVTAGSAEKVKLNSIRWNQSGSAALADLANVLVYVDSTSFVPTVSADGKYYSAVFGGIIIDKGASVEILVKGDIVSGSGRTIDFDLYKTTDLNVEGVTYGYGITPPTTGSGFVATNPWYDAYAVTVSGGSLTVETSNTVVSQNIAINLANQPLGGFAFEAKGEPVSVASMVFTIATATGSGSGLLTSVSLVNEAGLVVAGPVDAVIVGVGATQQTVTFTDTVTFPVAKGVYTLKGKVPTTAPTNGTYITSFNPSTAFTSITGQTTGNAITAAPNSTITGKTMTVKAAAVTVSVSNSPAAQTVVAGAQAYTFANYQFDATASGEDIRFPAFPLEFSANGNTATNITGCTLYDGATQLTTGSNVKNPTASASSTSFTFDTPLVIPKGVVKTIAVKCNIAAAATGTYNWGYDSSSSPSGTGVTSGQTATVTENDSVGQVMTLVAGGTLTVIKDSSSASYAIASAGTTGVTLGVLKFHAAYEAIDLKKVAIQLTNTASSSASDLVAVSLWADGAKVGETIFTGSNRNATTTLTTSVIIPKDGDKLITIKGDLTNIGVSAIGTQGHLVAVDYDGDDSTGTQGVGASSGSTISQDSATDTAMDGVRVFKSFPTFAKVAVPTNVLSNGEKSLLRFKVTADGAGDVGLFKFTLQMATTTCTAASLNIYAFTDAGYSTVVSGLSSDGGMLMTDFNLGTWTDSAMDLNITAQTSAGVATTIQVPAGQSRYFDVKATISNAGSGDSVSTQLQGDIAYPGLATTFVANTASVDADTDDDFIWSPNATTSSTGNHADWTNGYGVSGLPGSNMTAETLSL